MSLALSIVIMDFPAAGMMMIGVLEGRLPPWLPEPAFPELTTGPPTGRPLGGGIIDGPPKKQLIPSTLCRQRFYYGL